MKNTKELVKKYTGILPLKILLQQVPYISGILDLILSEKNTWREKRKEVVLHCLDERLKAV
jgi:hypothetical protein